MKKQFLEAGKIVGTHGVAGEMRVEGWMDSPDDLCKVKILYFHEGRDKAEVERMRVHKNMVLMKIKAIDTMNDAQAQRGKILYINREDLHLPEGSYFIQDLIGLTVLDDQTGDRYGTIAQVSPTGANDVYHVKDDAGKVTLIPAIPDVIVSVDMEKEICLIHPLRGLFDNED